MNTPVDRSVVNEITSALKVILEPDQVVELRALEVTVAKGRSIRVVSGYFDNIDLLANEAARLTQHAKGVYFTPNPVDTALLARAVNRTRPADHEPTTSDSDITHRRWLLIDADPVRPSGISASNKEHDAALERAKEIRADLAELGWPLPILADSGNGAHLLYRVDLSRDDEDLLKKVLEALAFRFDDSSVTVDRKVYNPARICKLYGTMSRKGDNIPDRPHRLSRLLDIPDSLKIVSLDQLTSIASNVPDLPVKNGARRENDRFEIDSWITDHGLDLIGPTAWNNGRKWIFRVCPWNPEHRNRSAYLLQFSNGAIAAGCHHNSCTGNDWHALRDLVEPNWRQEQSTSDKSRGQAASDGETSSQEKRSQADTLVSLVENSGACLFKDQHGDAFARIPNAGHWEIQRCRSKTFRNWLSMLFWDELEKVPNSDAVNSVLSIAEAKAAFMGKEYRLWNRVAFHDGAIWYDLADADWRAVRIDPTGWEIVANPPILFYRYAHQKQQVEPCRGGDLVNLLRFVNLRDEQNGLLLLIYLVSCFIPDIAHPIPILHGVQGAAKTTLLRILRRMVDPSSIEVLSFPRDNNELVQQLSHNWQPYYDNITNMPDWISDVLCRAVTGQGFAKRELYTNDDDVIYHFRRCVGLNGINVAAQKADLLDRSILLSLEPIAPEKRRSEQEFWEEFERLRPSLLGATFDVLSKAMALQSSIKPPRLPRLADFAIWGCAIADALGSSGDSFLKAFDENIAGRNDEAIAASPVATVMLAFMETCDHWEGEPSGLLAELESVAEDCRVNTRSSEWPKGAHILTRRLNEVKPNLAAAGIHIDHGNKHGRRMIHVRKNTAESVISVTNVINQDSKHDNEQSTDDATDDESGIAPLVTPPNQEAADANDASDATIHELKERIIAALQHMPQPIEPSPGNKITDIEGYAISESASVIRGSAAVSRLAQARLQNLGIEIPQVNQLQSGVSNRR